MDALLNLAFLTAILSCVACALYFVTRRPLWSRACVLLLGVNAGSGLGYLVWRGLVARHFPLSNTFEALLVLLVLSLAILPTLYRRLEQPADLLLPAVLWVCLGYGILALLDSSIRPLMPALRSNWLFFHVFSSMLAYAAFAIAGVWSAVQLFRRGSASADQTLLRLARLGFGFLTLGIITGSVWAERAWGRYWSWDPKETWSLITWILYALSLHLALRGWRGKKLAWMLVIGLLAVFFTFFGVNYLLGGLHSYA